MRKTVRTTVTTLGEDTYGVVDAYVPGGGLSASTAHKVGHFQPDIRVVISASTGRLKATFNPVSAERDRRTALLNETVRLGYRPARASTK